MLERHGGDILGVWDVEMGPCAQYVMLWRFQDFMAYEQCMRDVYQDPEGVASVAKYKALEHDCERWLLRPTMYSPLK